MGQIYSSFVNALRNVPFPSAADTGNSPGTTARGATAISITGNVDPGGADSTGTDSTGNNNSSGGIISNWRSLTELLLPTTIGGGVYYSIPPHVQHRQPLYELLLALVLLSISLNVAAIYYAFRRNLLTAIEAEQAELVKERLLKVGLLYSLFAVLLRIMLQLSLASLGYLVLMYFAAGMPGAIYLYIHA